MCTARFFHEFNNMLVAFVAFPPFIPGAPIIIHVKLQNKDLQLNFLGKGIPSTYVLSCGTPQRQSATNAEALLSNDHRVVNLQVVNLQMFRQRTKTEFAL